LLIFFRKIDNRISKTAYTLLPDEFFVSARESVSFESGQGNLARVDIISSERENFPPKTRWTISSSAREQAVVQQKCR